MGRDKELGCGGSRELGNAFLVPVSTWSPSTLELASAQVLLPPDQRHMQVELSSALDTPKGHTELHH
jgi:hypothetical protein